MASPLRAWITDNTLWELATHNRKLNPDMICDRVNAWKDDTGNARKHAAIVKLSGEIAQLREVIIPDNYWQPDLRETLAAQLCAIQSAIDRLKARSPNDASSLGSALKQVRDFYLKPMNWPTELGDDHIQMMLEILKYAIEKCQSNIAADSSYGKPKACHGRVSEALEQAFLYRKRGLPYVSDLTNELFSAFELVYEEATAVLIFEMKSQKGPRNNSKHCKSTLEEQPQSPSESDAEEEDGQSEANECEEEAEGASQICACRLTRKMQQVDHEMAQKKQRSRDKNPKRAMQGHNSKPLNPSPLGQFVEAAYIDGEIAEEGSHNHRPMEATGIPLAGIAFVWTILQAFMSISASL
ncbi:hypothetical protein PG993_002854 [Apiospora rasikravindrae]|uniref:Uncharacterized protein n=1 Tax=Apiospora rasikravindrae TaxID=990691 RepID=A0ABR1U0K3_9PEZI